MIDKKISLLIPKISRKTGGLSSAWDMAEALYDLGFSVCVFTFGSYHTNLKNRGRINVSIPFDRIHSILGVFDHKPSTKLGLKQRLRKLVYGTLNPKPYKSFTKEFLESGIIIDFSSLPIDQIKKLKSKTDAQLVMNHAGSPESYLKFWSKELEDEEARKAYVEICNAYDHIFFQSNRQLEESSEITKLDKDRYWFVPPSCEENEVMSSSNQESPYVQSGFNCVIVGSIQERKGIHLGLQVLEGLVEKGARIHFHFVGKKPALNTERWDYFQEQLNFVEEHSLSEYLTFHDHRSDYLRFIHHADCIIQPSLAEGVSRILRESMLLSKPIVAFDISGTSDLLDHAKNAMLIEAYNVQEMTESILRLMKDEKLTGRLGNAALKKYKTHNSKTNYYLSLNGAIQGIVEKELI